MKRLILLLTIVFLDAGLRAASVLPVGEGKFTYKDYPPFADRPVDVHYYIPASGDVRCMPIVFVFEGADRGYTYLLKAWKQEAEKHKFMVFIPPLRFGKVSFTRLSGNRCHGRQGSYDTSG